MLKASLVEILRRPGLDPNSSTARIHARVAERDQLSNTLTTGEVMEILLLVAHGSRKEAANQEVRELAARIEQQSAASYQTVVPAFLEFAQPDIANGVDQCVKLGAKKITVVPYFLSAGAHVNRDVPDQLEAARLRHPSVNLRLTPHIGAADGILQSVIDCAS
jgi:sirohydrochlorin ferrochelatase